MRTASSVARDAAGCCCQPLDRRQVVSPRPTAGSIKRSLDIGLTMLGMLGWLCVPKCPMCLTAYLAIGTGISVSLGHSQVLRQTLLVLAAGLFFAGAWRLATCARRWLQSRSTLNGTAGVELADKY